MVKKISASEFEQVKASKAAVIDFSATWCGPCKMLAPVLEEISASMEGKVDFFNVDVDENPSLAAEYGIQSIPALVVLKEGQKANMMVGFRPKEDVTKFIEAQL